MGQFALQRPMATFISGPERWRLELKNRVRERYAPMSAARVL